MNTLITTTARKMLTRSFAAGLIVAAMATLAGATAAHAVDQQMNDQARDDATNHRAVEQGYGYSYGYSVAPRYPSGAYARAPRWMQAAGLEWLHRLIREPKRLFWRYAVTNPVAIFLLLTRTNALPADALAPGQNVKVRAAA